MRSAGIEDDSLGFQYVVSLHWSLAQFTPGASPVHPLDITERFFAVAVLALGLVMGTCFMSSITSTMASVWTLNRFNNTQHVLLKKFLNQNKVSRALGSRITRYVDFILASRLQRVHGSKVHFLTLLSGPLHIELQTELFEPVLSAHHCFKQISSVCKPVAREMCTTAVDTHNFAKNDTLFTQGREAKQMMFLTLGSLGYRYHPRTDSPPKKVSLETGSWFSEVALWMPWRHVGMMKALAEADTISVGAAKFRDIVTNHHDIYLIARSYAFSFWQEAEENKETISDVPHKMLPAKGRKFRDATGSLECEVAHSEAVEAEITKWDV